MNKLCPLCKQEKPEVVYKGLCYPCEEKVYIQKLKEGGYGK
jgi:hypothetical protein